MSTDARDWVEFPEYLEPYLKPSDRSPELRQVKELTISVFPDGGAFCALIGEDLQSGVAGFGSTVRSALGALKTELFLRFEVKKNG